MSTFNRKSLENKNKEMKKSISIKGAPAPIGAYSQAVDLNGLVFISGQIPLNPVSGELVMENIKAETTQVMENIKSLLDAAGLTFDNVLKCSIFISDMNNFNEINEVYGSYFSGVYPARECVEVARLPKDVNVEISVIANK